MTQRAYRAACPNCGAPVEFASAASASAVCGFCRSTLVRDGEALKRIGVSAELFDDHSPLQLGTSGRYKGLAFTIVGRLQYAYSLTPRAAASPAPPPEGAAGRPGEAGSGPDGTWNEWHALFDGGRSGWLSEDNGAYVFAFDAPWPADAPADEQSTTALGVGRTLRVDNRAWTVASIVRTRLQAAQGELPYPPRLDGDFVVIDLRNSADEVGTLDYADARQPHWSTGRPVLLGDLALSGLAETGEKALSGRGIECPGCGASLEIKLSTTQAIACPQCRTVTDISQGVGGELEHYRQNNSGAGGLQPLIALGKSASLTLGTPRPADWQAVGYLERCDLPAPGDDDEQVFWREYLLFNREHGFAFLVDAEDGWSWVRPVTGVPQPMAQHVNWAGVLYNKRYTYRARVTWVLGEFYWRVRRNEEATVSDYAGVGKASRKRLSLEQTAHEAVWSAGETMDAVVVARAFGVAPGGEAAFKRDVSPFDAGKATSSARRTMIILVIFVTLMVLLTMCSSGGCDDVRSSFGPSSAEYQQCLASNRNSGSSGGSWGGYSSGGGHK